MLKLSLPSVLVLLSTIARAEYFCPTQILSTRSGTETCWVQWGLGDQQALCIPRILWKKWLLSKTPSSLCGNWQGKWKAISPLSNDLHRKHQKEVMLRFIVQEFPKSDEISMSKIQHIFRHIEKLREKMSEKLKLNDHDGILRSLFLNEKIPGSPLSFYRQLGFVHVFSASGIHLYALALWVSFCVLHLGSLLKISAEKAVIFGRIFSFLIWVFAWILSGMRPGLLRPWILVFLRTASHALGFRWRFWSPLLLALAVDGAVAVRNDFSWAPGRLHYALAVGGGLAALELRGKNQNILYSHVLMSVGSWLPTALLDGFESYTIAWATPLLSLLTIPMIASTLYPLMMTGCVFFSLGFENLSSQSFDFVGHMTTLAVHELALMAIRFQSLWVVTVESLFMGGLLSVGLGLVIWIYLRVSFQKLSFLFVLLSGLLCFRFYSRPVKNTNCVEQLDVGQGDAAIVFSSDQKIGLVDSGSEKALSIDQWIRVLGSRGIFRLDWIALTHLDEDHLGGVFRLANILKIESVVLSERGIQTDRGKKLKKELGQRGVKVTSWDQGVFPFEAIELVTGEVIRKNRVQTMSAYWIPLASGSSYLSMGDAPHLEEKNAMVWLQNLKLKYPGGLIFKLSHHGSRYSTSSEILKILKPEKVWISSGVGNRYGHPTDRVLRLLGHEKILTLRTDEVGSLR